MGSGERSSPEPDANKLGTLEGFRTSRDGLHAAAMGFTPPRWASRRRDGLHAAAMGFTPPRWALPVPRWGPRSGGVGWVAALDEGVAQAGRDADLVVAVDDHAFQVRDLFDDGHALVGA